MTTLSSLLPKPKNTYNNEEEEDPLFQKKTVTTINNKEEVDNKPKKIIPPYGKRKGYLPKNIEDFGDGGAFPEIHIVQYPLDMGRKSKSKGGANGSGSGSGNSSITGTSTSIVPINVDSSGRVKYEAILGAKSSLHSQYKDLIPKQFTENDLQRPDDQELQETLDRTKNALEKIVNGKIKSSKSTNQVDVEKKGATYIKYTPSNQSGGTANGLNSKIIRMVDVAQDPMEPPKYKIKKKSKEHGSPPAPVMHSPTRKLTVQEHQDWTIPPCISNWKNPKGYAIAIDKRLASNGGGLQDVEINDKFAHFTQALYIAESNAREEVAARSELERKLAQKEKERKQEMLRKLAEDVRNERSGIIQQRSNGSRRDNSDSDDSGSDSDSDSDREDKRRTTTTTTSSSSSRSNDSDNEDDNRYRNKDNRGNRRIDDSPERRDDRRDSRDSRDSRDYRSSDNRRDNSRERREISSRDNRRDNSRDRDSRDSRDRRDYRSSDSRRDSRDRSNSRDRYKKKHSNRSDSESSSSEDSEDERSRKERKEKLERDKLRIEKKRELEREYRLEASGKKSKFNRDQDRDISEKIALGQASASRTEDSIYDQRLFNQSESLGSGFGNDDAYNVYSKPLFGGAVSNSIYRPKSNQEDNTTVEDVLSKSRFGKEGGGQRPNKEFSGADRSKERTGPVAFEKEKKKSDDPFGFNDFSKK